MKVLKGFSSKSNQIMGQKPKLVYSPRYQVNVNLEDFWCTSAQNHEFGKRIVMYHDRRYADNPPRGLYLHRVVADATCYNPRPDIFDTVDHIDGNPKNNHPSNLRWVNQHLNSNSLHFEEGSLPPGVNTRKKKTRRGKWYNSIYFRRCGFVLKTFRTLQAAVDFGAKHHKEHFKKLYEAYLNSPRDEFEARKYWAERLITQEDFTVDIRKNRKKVLAFEKFLVCDGIYKKLTFRS